ncbi:unnamed protein product [Calypogeia fissa]
MAVNPTDILTALTKAFNQFTEFRDDWVNASNDIQSEADSVNVTINRYVDLFRGRILGKELVDILERATFRLESANNALKGLHEDMTGSNACWQHIWWFYVKLNLALFPQSLKNTLLKVREDLKKLDDILNEANANAAGLGVRDYEKNQGIFTIVYDNDKKYVAIEESQSAVIKAVEESGGPLIILLHGSFGTGKSTLARKMCNLYGRNGEKSGEFDHVIPVACENCKASDVTSKQYEILSNYAPTTVSKDDKDSKERIKSDFKSFFKGKRILMILDKLSDPEFLSSMLKAVRDDNDSKDDKILITSQRSTLCDGICKDDTRSIPMATPTNEEAKKILASLVGLENKQIPDHLQDIADEVIAAYDGNPQALASFASTFSNVADKTIKEQWEDALDAIPELLKPPAQTSPSVNSSIMKEFQALESPARSLQSLLRYGMRHHVVGTEQEMKDVIGALIDNGSRKQDNDTEKAEAETGMIASDEMKLRVALCALYFDSHHTDEVVRNAVTEAYKRSGLVDCDDTTIDLKQTVIEDLVWLLDQREVRIKWAVEDQGRLRKVLLNYICECKLDSENISYLLKFKPSAQVPILKTIINISHLEQSRLFYENTIGFVQAIVELLSLKVSVDTTVQLAASEALVHVCRKAWLDKSAALVANIPGVMDLLADALAHPVARLDEIATNGVLAVVALTSGSKTSVEESDIIPQLIVNKDGIVPGLVKFMSQEINPELQRVAAVALSNLLDSEDNDVKLRIDNEEDAAVAKFGHCLSNYGNNQVGLQAGQSLASLLATADESFKLKIADGTLASLVHCLLQENNGMVVRQLRAVAAEALGSLANCQEHSLRLRIADAKGALAGLVNGLSQGKNGVLKEKSARALAILSVCELEPLKLKIANEPGALAGLVNGLSQNDNADLKIWSAQALGSLADCQMDSLRVGIANAKGALAGLVNCLSQGNNVVLRKWSARALAALSGCKLESLKLEIANEPGTLAALANGLSQHNNDDLKRYAAEALGSLAKCQEVSLKLRIADTQGVLAGLVSCLSQGDNVMLKDWSARGLALLSDCKLEPLKLKIANQPGALAGLANGLSQHDSDILKLRCAHALGSLADCKDESLKLRIADAEGALAGLVNCLSQGDNVQLKRVSVRALAFLSDCKLEPLQLKLANEPGAVEGLANSLSQHSNDNLKIWSAKTLGCLASYQDDSLKVRIAKGALAGLVNCLSQGDNVVLKEWSIWAVVNLSACELVPLKLKIANEPGALAGLANGLSQPDRDRLKMLSAKALGSLANCEQESLKLRIANTEGVLAGLVNCLSEGDNVDLKEVSAATLAVLAKCREESLKLRIAEGALGGLVSCLSQGSNIDLRLMSAMALANLSTSDNNALKLKVAKEEGAPAALEDSLSQCDQHLLRHAARIAENLACSPDAKLILLETQGLLQRLTNLLGNSDADSDTQRAALKAITLLLEK